MSGFSQQDVFGFSSMVIPGNQVSVQNPGNLGFGGPGIEGISWGPTGLGEGSVGALAGFMNGGIAPDVVEYAKFPSNDFITAKYTVKPWTQDKSHLYIREGMLVFGMSQMDAQFRDLVNMAALPKMNALLKEQHAIFDKYGNQYRELMDYKNALQQVSEKQIEGELYKRRNQPNAKRDDSMDLVIRSLNAPVARYQMACGILATWNLLGNVRTISQATTGEDMYSYDGTDKVGSYTVTAAKYCQLGNVWGSEEFGDNVNTGSRLYLILKREERPDGSFGAFRFFPYATRFYSKPPRALTVYQNPFTHEWEEGKVIYVGVVTRMSDRDSTPGVRETAAGLGPNPSVQAAYEAHGSTPFIEVQLGV